MVKLNMTGFKPVEFKRGDLVLQQGGLAGLPRSLVTKEIRCGEAGTLQAIYIRVKSRESWLGPACMSVCNRGSMHLGVVRELQNRVMDIEKRIRNGDSPLEDTAAPETDPMDDLGDFDEMEPQNNTKKGGKKRNSFVSQVVRITMPDWPPEALTGGEAPNPRAVSVFVEGTGVLWIHSDDLEWLIRFLVIQQQLKGVPVVAEDDEGPDAAERMDFEMTPEKCPEPQQDNGHLHDKWALAP